MAAVTICSDFGNKVCHCFHYFPIYCNEVMRQDAMILVSWTLSFKPAFSHSSFILSRSSLVPLYFLRLGWCQMHIWGYWYFSQKSRCQLVLHPAWHFTWCTLHISQISKVTTYSLDLLLSQFGTSPSCCLGTSCSMSGSNCCFLTSI